MKNEMKILDIKKYNYSPCFEVISIFYRNRSCKIYDKVFGIIYRYCLMQNGVCYASVRHTLAKQIGVTPKIFGEAIKVLESDGFITTLSKNNTNTYACNTDKVEELLLRGEVETTTQVKSKLHQSDVETTAKDTDSSRIAFKDSAADSSLEVVPESTQTLPNESIAPKVDTDSTEVSNLLPNEIDSTEVDNTPSWSWNDTDSKVEASADTSASTDNDLALKIRQAYPCLIGG